MVGESKIRAWWNRITQSSESQQMVSEQNAVAPAMDAVLHEFNTQLGV